MAALPAIAVFLTAIMRFLPALVGIFDCDRGYFACKSRQSCMPFAANFIQVVLHAAACNSSGILREVLTA